MDIQCKWEERTSWMKETEGKSSSRTLKEKEMEENGGMVISDEFNGNF